MELVGTVCDATGVRSAATGRQSDCSEETSCWRELAVYVQNVSKNEVNLSVYYLYILINKLINSFH